jgi:hypothetical protein
MSCVPIGRIRLGKLRSCHCRKGVQELAVSQPPSMLGLCLWTCGHERHEVHATLTSQQGMAHLDKDEIDLSGRE